jgi:hypothetical protein
MPRSALAELAAPTEISFQLELFADIEIEVQALAAAHFQEVDGGVEPKRPFQLDADLMRYGSKCGNLRIYTARVDGQLAGYCTWNVQYDVESRGLFIATQGAWYTDPCFSANGLGLRLFKWSLKELKSLGVQCVFPHHRMQGRGTDERLGRWLCRQGAKLIKKEYSLWIGD